MTQVNVSMQQNVIEPKTYRIGMWIVFDGQLLLLSQGKPWEVAAISPGTGNRYFDAVCVKNTLKITEEEMRTILGQNDYEKIDIDKVVVVKELNIEVK